MKRKIYAILLAVIFFGAGAVAVTGAVNDFDYSFLNSVTSLSEYANAEGSTNNAELISSSSELTPPRNEITSTTTVTNREYLTNLDQKDGQRQIIGQWGYVNNPKPERVIICWYDRQTMRGSFGLELANPVDFEVRLYSNYFRGELYLRTQSLALDNELGKSKITAVPFFGVYSITNDYITAFWTKGDFPSSVTTVDEHIYDCWFFGEFQ